jgi:hypothetical protein
MVVECLAQRELLFNLLVIRESKFTLESPIPNSDYIIAKVASK